MADQVLPALALLPRRRLGDRRPRHHDTLCRRTRQWLGLRWSRSTTGSRLSTASGCGRRRHRRSAGWCANRHAEDRSRSASPSAATAPAATPPRWWRSPARCRRAAVRGWQLLIYPATDQQAAAPSHASNGQGLPADLRHDGLLHGPPPPRCAPLDADWRASPLLHHGPLAPAALRWCSPPASTRCATRARPTRRSSSEAAGAHAPVLRAPDPRLHPDGQGAGRGQRRGAPALTALRDAG